MTYCAIWSHLFNYKIYITVHISIFVNNFHVVVVCCSQQLNFTKVKI